MREYGKKEIRMESRQKRDAEGERGQTVAEVGERMGDGLGRT